MYVNNNKFNQIKKLTYSDNVNQLSKRYMHTLIDTYMNTITE